MVRRPNPISDHQVNQRIRLMKEPGGWLEQVYRILAFSIYRAAQEHAWNDPDWNFDDGQEVIDRADWPVQVERIREELAERLRRSELVDAAFFERHSRRVGQMLSVRQIPITTLYGPYQSVYRDTDPGLGLPPKDHPLAPTAEIEQEVALAQVAWEAAKELYQQIGNPNPDGDNRYGLEQPELLHRWCVMLGLAAPETSLEVPGLGDAKSTRATTALPFTKAQNTLLSPRIEPQNNGGPPGHRHRKTEQKQDKYDVLVYMARESSAVSGAGPIAWAQVGEAQKLLEQYGLEAARMSLYLATYVCKNIENPMAPFVLNGDTILEDFNLLKSRSGGRGRVAIEERSRTLKGIMQVLTELDRVMLQLRDYTGKTDKNGNRQLREYKGRLWNIDFYSLKTEREAQVDDATSVLEEDVVTDLKVRVTPGAWVGAYLTPGIRGGMWYGEVPTDVLKLSASKNQMALALGLTFAPALHENHARNIGYVTFKVGTLLNRAFGRQLEKAKTNRDAARDLREKWKAALEILREQIGFGFEFCPMSYPSWAIPDNLRSEESRQATKVPRNALEQLLNGIVTVHWPQPVIEASQRQNAEQKALEAAEKVRRKARSRPLLSRKAITGLTNAEAFREVCSAVGLRTQREIAEVLGTSQTSVCRLLGPNRSMSLAELNAAIRKVEVWLDGLENGKKRAEMQARFERVKAELRSKTH